ncbi:MAG: bifunctional folylpolyglutamate synthase/ dihydrofolate synthase [Desulfovibrionaceae bacterium]|nr:bifunctional folylpolyglutamate synthase/ dihydrofolate synthase [Desulfovibrionaceae bacterium]
MPHTFPDLQSFDSYLDRLNFFHMDLSLDRMDRVLEAMDLKNPPCRIVQVVGTNGKGSTATFLASLLRAKGVRTGLYTSPHFCSPAERIQVDGRRTDMAGWLDAAGRAVTLCPELTYFELLTVIALDVFRSLGVEAAVLEAGLGAKYDATTAARADMAVFAPIALDHTRLLGETVAAIAGEKSHAIRSAAPVVCAPQTPEAMRVLEARALSFGAPLTRAEPLSDEYALGLCGEHQSVNAGTALAAMRELERLCAAKCVLPGGAGGTDAVPAAADEKIALPASDAVVREGLAGAFLPGRLQTVRAACRTDTLPARPVCVLDGAHNPHGMTSLVRALHAGRCPSPCAVVYSCLADKDWRGALTMLARELAGSEWHVPAIPGERSERPEAIRDFLLGLGETRVTAHASCLEAFAALDGEGKDRSAGAPVLVTGSLYLLSEFYALWPDALEPPAPLSE